MSLFQLLLFLIAGGIFYLFLKQLFSGNHPKRGIDFKADLPNEQIGGINRPDKTFSKPVVSPTRIGQLLDITDKAVAREDFSEAKKALQSAIIIDENSIEVLQRSGFVAMVNKEYEEAKEFYTKIISLDNDDDMAHVSLANAYNKLGERELSIKHHIVAIDLDSDYAPHYFNYANTLYELGDKQEALIEYQNAYKLDNSLEDAKKMIDKLGILPNSVQTLK